jgi:thiamine phosphate synthase YjbQ (UPF0047 family)
MTNDRDKILQRILNLRAKAENEASSESEMNTALTMAAKIMDSYRVAEAELALAEAEGRIKLEVVSVDIDTTALKTNSRQIHKIVSVLSAISYYTETQHVYYSRNGVINFVGHKPDVELANYLVALIKESLDREYNNYKNSHTAIGYGAKNSFQMAMSRRICYRLIKMRDEANEQRDNEKTKAEMLKIEDRDTASSTAIVIANFAEEKKEETSKVFKKYFPNTRTVHSNSVSNNMTAHAAGKIAGDKINLGKSISEGSVKKISYS